MNLLLDTHIIVWVASAPHKIGQAATRRLEDPRTELWYSPLSVYEILKLQESGKLTGKLRHGDPRWWFPELKKALNLREAPVTAEITLETASFRLPTGDPIDSLLVATARVLKLTFFTADRPITDSGAVATLPNR
jgi:PIN domain nuclease of toxin-antitoxin system